MGKQANEFARSEYARDNEEGEQKWVGREPVVGKQRVPHQHRGGT
jgi:hypothetical protein